MKISTLIIAKKFDESISVSVLNTQIKSLLETTFMQVFVSGERFQILQFMVQDIFIFL